MDKVAEYEREPVSEGELLWLQTKKEEWNRPKFLVRSQQQEHAQPPPQARLALPVSPVAASPAKEKAANKVAATQASSTFVATNAKGAVGAATAVRHRTLVPPAQRARPASAASNQARQITLVPSITERGGRAFTVVGDGAVPVKAASPPHSASQPPKENKPKRKIRLLDELPAAAVNSSVATNNAAPLQELPPPPPVERKTTESKQGTDDLDSLVEGLKGMTLSRTQCREGANDPLARRLQLGREGQKAAEERGYMLLEEYEAAVQAHILPPYKAGKQYATVRERYEGGWVFKVTTKRWAKADKQEKEASVRFMEKENEALKKNMDNLNAALAQAAPGTSAAARDPSLAPVILIMDTNCWLKFLPQVQAFVVGMSMRVPDASLVIPREVLRELDRKKMDSNNSIAFQARSAVRFISELLKLPPRIGGEGKSYPVARGQDDAQLHRDEGHHQKPAALRGDDAILNCALFMKREAERSVFLCSDDRLFRQRAFANGIGVLEASDMNLDCLISRQ